MAEKTKITLDVDDLTLGDLEDFEAATGESLTDLIEAQQVLDDEGRPVPDPNDPKGRPLMQTKVPTKAIVGLAFISMRKDNPGVTINDVRQMRLSDFDFELEAPPEETENPTEPASEETSES